DGKGEGRCGTKPSRSTTPHPEHGMTDGMTVEVPRATADAGYSTADNTIRAAVRARSLLHLAWHHGYGATRPWQWPPAHSYANRPLWRSVEVGLVCETFFLDTTLY